MSQSSILKFNVSLGASLAIVAVTVALLLIPFSPTKITSCLHSGNARPTVCLSESRTIAMAADDTFDEHSPTLKPLGDVTIPQIIGKIIQSLIGFTGLIALVMFITGGFRWMLAAGNQEAIGKAKKTVTWAVLGLVMVFASYAIVNLVIGTLAP